VTSGATVHGASVGSGAGVGSGASVSGTYGTGSTNAGFVVVVAVAGRVVVVAEVLVGELVDGAAVVVAEV